MKDDKEEDNKINTQQNEQQVRVKGRNERGDMSGIRIRK